MSGRYCVLLSKIPPTVACCGAVGKVRTEIPVGTVISIDHAPRCRVGKLLRRPADCTRTGFEPLPTTDNRVVKR